MINRTKLSPVQCRWVGFKVVRGTSGYVAKKLKNLGFFKGGKEVGFDYVKPCGTDAGSTLARMREQSIKGVANVFTDLNWKHQRITDKQRATNYAD